MSVHPPRRQIPRHKAVFIAAPFPIECNFSGPERVKPPLIVWFPPDAERQTIITIKRCKRLFNAEQKHKLKGTKDIYVFACIKCLLNYLLPLRSAVPINNRRVSWQACNFIQLLFSTPGQFSKVLLLQIDVCWPSLHFYTVFSSFLQGGCS